MSFQWIRRSRHNDGGFQWIHDLKKALGLGSVKELLALSPKNDPFYAGSPGDIKQADWFARMWEKEYTNQTGIHIRRVHYRLDAISYPKLDGTPYRNPQDWDHLQLCCRVARLLGKVPVEAFEDHRNAAPYPFLWTEADIRKPSALVLPSGPWSTPSLDLGMRGGLDWKIARPLVSGYEPDDSLDRCYYLELWVEKSTMDDILVPLCEALGIQLITSSGYQSISNAVRVLERIAERGKPTRIFYISDYDKAGKHMPVSVARQIEYWREQFAPDQEIKLIPLALTLEQIEQYKLPTNEVGATELDALEAIVPGELAKIVRQATAPYLDFTLPRKLRAADGEARKIVEAEWSATVRPFEQRLSKLQKQVATVIKRYERETKALDARLQRDLAPWKKQLAKLQAELAGVDFAPDLPERPTQETSDVDESEVLFDSERDYLEQIEFYKKRKSESLPEESEEL